MPQKVKGTREFWPEDKARQNYIFDTWRAVCKKFGFQEIDGPEIEDTELFRIKSGDEIVNEIFNFKDKAGRDICLRPEFTPILARMAAEKQLPRPQKWFSIGRFWRYESPQQGREREFWQLNVDITGAKGTLADAELITLAIQMMKAFKVNEKEFFIRISNRKLIQSILQSINLNEKQTAKVYNLIDKRCKLSGKDFKAALKEEKLSEKQIKEIDKMMEINDLKSVEKYKLDPLGQEGLKELKELFDYLKDYKKFINLDFSLVRGLDYYTGNVFEIFDRSMEFRAIAGGGRYDSLIKLLGNVDMPATGFAIGDVVLSLFLEKLGKMPDIKREIEFYIAPVNEKVLGEAVKIANSLREKNNVEIDLMNRSLGKQFEYANSIGAKKVIIVGEKDMAKKKVTVRDMKTGKEKLIGIKELLK